MIREIHSMRRDVAPECRGIARQRLYDFGRIDQLRRGRDSAPLMSDAAVVPVPTVFLVTPFAVTGDDPGDVRRMRAVDRQRDKNAAAAARAIKVVVRGV